MSDHQWVKSTLGHGTTMCSACNITDREAAALGELGKCTAPAPLPDPVREAVERIMKTAPTALVQFSGDEFTASERVIIVRQDDLSAILNHIRGEASHG